MARRLTLAERDRRLSNYVIGALLWAPVCLTVGLLIGEPWLTPSLIIGGAPFLLIPIIPWLVSLKEGDWLERIAVVTIVGLIIALTIAFN